MDEIEDKNGNIVHAQGLEKLILLKCPFYAVPLQIPTAFSTEIQQTLKVCMESQRPLKIKGILRMKNKAIGITPPDFKLHYKTPVIKTHTHRSMGQNKELKNKPLIRYMIYKYFLPVDELHFHFVDGFLCCTEPFSLMQIHLLLLLLPLFLMSNLKDGCQDSHQEAWPLGFFF